ncbi:MAG: hypothetical protein JSV74_00500 [Dehalococcoidia bacterium]|nr:MAG: hypothetical protein JSV74_00500 [Dehalococcoidia bacterium]
MFKRLLKQDWEVVAVLLAALTGLVFHFLHLTEVDLLLAIAVVLLALFLIRDIKRESQAGHFAAIENSIATNLEDIKSSLTPPSVELIGPSELHETSLRFAKRGQGDVVFFNICLRMYKSQKPFDIMLKPFIENSEVTSVQFILDLKEKERWERDIMPKVVVCNNAKKVREPYWCHLEENTSFILVETGSFGKAEALVSFWGEPFMAKTSGVNVPRYVLYVREDSGLIRSLKERERISRSA